MNNKSQGWKLFGWIVILIILYGVIFGAFWMVSKSRKEKIEMQELDVQIELNAPANIPIRTATVKQINKQLVGKSRIDVNSRNEFVSLLKGNGTLWVVETIQGPRWTTKRLLLGRRSVLAREIVVTKAYYYIPQGNGTISFVYEDDYRFWARNIWRPSKIFKLTPNHVIYINLVLEKFYR